MQIKFYYTSSTSLPCSDSLKFKVDNLEKMGVVFAIDRDHGLLKAHYGDEEWSVDNIPYKAMESVDHLIHNISLELLQNT